MYGLQGHKMLEPCGSNPQRSAFFQVNAVVAINGPHMMSNYANLKENGELLPEAE